MSSSPLDRKHFVLSLSSAIVLCLWAVTLSWIYFVALYQNLYIVIMYKCMFSTWELLAKCAYVCF